MPPEAVSCEICGSRPGATWSREVFAWRCAEHRPPAGLDLLAAIAEERALQAGIPACEACGLALCAGCGPACDAHDTAVVERSETCEDVATVLDDVDVRLLDDERAPLVVVLDTRTRCVLCHVMSDGHDDVSAIGLTEEAALGELVSRYARRLAIGLPPLPVPVDRLGAGVRAIASDLRLEVVDVLGYVRLRAAESSARLRPLAGGRQ